MVTKECGGQQKGRFPTASRESVAPPRPWFQHNETDVELWLPELYGINVYCFKPPHLLFVMATGGNEGTALWISFLLPVLPTHLSSKACSLTWCLFQNRTRHMSFFKPEERWRTHLVSSPLFLYLARVFCGCHQHTSSSLYHIHVLVVVLSKSHFPMEYPASEKTVI